MTNHMLKSKIIPVNKQGQYGRKKIEDDVYMYALRIQ